MKCLAMLYTLMLSLLLGVHFFVIEKRDHVMEAHFSAGWPIRSGEPTAEGQTPVIPRGFAPGTVPDEPRTRDLTGSGALERDPPVNRSANLISFYRVKISAPNFLEPKASEKV